MLVALRRRIARPVNGRVVSRALHSPSKASAKSPIEVAAATSSSSSSKRTFSDVAVTSTRFENPEDENVPWWKAIAWASLAILPWPFIVHYTKDAFHYPTGLLNEAPPTPAHWHWPQNDLFGTYDHASLRRGYDVYRQVCSQCHSMNNIAFRMLDGVTHTTEQVKELASTIMVPGDFDENGDQAKRPATPLDYFPNPYKNEAQARGANGGAIPPDLSMIAQYNHHGPDYVMSLLTGYNDPPPGIQQAEGKHWNTYFEGGWISMPPPLLVDEQVEYDDGTPATKSQMAKDVSHFLTWCYQDNVDHNHSFGIFLWMMLAATAVVDFWAWKHRRLVGTKTVMRYMKPRPKTLDSMKH